MDDPAGLRAAIAVEPKLNLVTITLCDACLDGEGGECHTSGCALWMSSAPDLAIRDHPMVESVVSLSNTYV